MFNKSITSLKGVGPKRAQLFEKLGVFDIDALFYFYPRSYIDLSNPLSPLEAPVDTPCAIRATVASPVKESRIRKGMTLYKFTAVEDGVTLKITIFNNKFLAQKVKENEEYIFYGSASAGLATREMSSPEIFKSGNTYIRPIYHTTNGLSSYVIESTVKSALEYADKLKDPIPDEIRVKYRLPDIVEAIKNIHFPKNQAQLKSAKRRLMFQEMLTLQCGLQYFGRGKKQNNAAKLKADFSAEFESMLSFALTNAQKKAIKQAVEDMQGSGRMNRMLQGDVGSGKTAVAASLCYTVCKNGYQAAVMAPTEILAEQHFNSFKALFDSTGINVALLTGSTTASAKREILTSLLNGDIDILIGTHAIISDAVEFKNLSLVITDEQHRFGVKQRAALTKKAEAPHVLVMSATPIPRTLALIIYGDLDLSVLDEMPAGRKPVETRLINAQKRDLAFDFISKQIKRGRQAFIVCPLIEDNESDLVSATKYFENLKKTCLGDTRLGLLHGKMSGKEKEETMKRFAKGEIDILVSTTVVEVGVDVPNASVMMIEGADRFGLSQLHQLRGRVGRGSHRSYCILVSDTQNEVTLKRLNVMCDTNDGFVIAEADLRTRGPGSFFGERQHGLPALKLSDLVEDINALQFAQDIAKDIIKRDPSLSLDEHNNLRECVEKMFGEFNGSLN